MDPSMYYITSYIENMEKAVSSSIISQRHYLLRTSLLTMAVTSPDSELAMIE